jgi:hypothetical protein
MPWLPKHRKVEQAAVENYCRWFNQCKQMTKVATYRNLMFPAGLPRKMTAAPYLELQNGSERRALAQFRTESHNLREEIGRYTIPKTPRSERYCPFCRPDQMVVEDRQHMLFECPLYADLRESHTDIFTGLQQRTVVAFLQQDGQDKIAKFINECWKKRSEAEEESYKNRHRRKRQRRRNT